MDFTGKVTVAVLTAAFGFLGLSAPVHAATPTPATTPPAAVGSVPPSSPHTDDVWKCC